MTGPAASGVAAALELQKDLARHLKADPPYQRRSVWTGKDRKFFLDTIFRNYRALLSFFIKKLMQKGGG